ncbi:hypothetical protein [Nonomuraea jiangxiensis]|uniref:Uncharacterized protein n=1 Tax=Nonomuraea jiangxiensis TaxID=633440 RepID=A0A1G9G5A9_9ACTN|nr:hypothetical protein [Nonomuraea jiangxiensis]SDK95918.1 hypothetical protein SAMN05421869_120182 [Nonomuraea jiangxiensis]
MPVTTTGVWDALADPLTALVVVVILVALASASRSCLLRLVLITVAIAELAWAGLRYAALGKPPGEILRELKWDGVLSFLERPLVALVLAVLLAFIGTRAGWRLTKLLAFCGAVAVLVWATIRYAAVGGVVSSFFQTIGTVLIWLIVAIVVISLAVIVAVVVMFLASPLPSRSPFARAHRLDFEGAETDSAARFLALADALVELVDDAIPDSAHPGLLLRFYFSGLRDLREEIHDIHVRCNQEIVDLAVSASREFPGLDADRLRALARKRVALPGQQEWAQLLIQLDARIPYVVLRLLVLRRDWREVATILYKCFLCYDQVAHSVARPD